MTILYYRSNVCVDDLAIDQCTVHRCGNSAGERWWGLWFRVKREDTGGEATVLVPIAPNGTYDPGGPGGKTWGLTRTTEPDKFDECSWQIAPSVNVLAGTDDLHAGEHAAPSQWHQTPLIVEVPDTEAWTRSAP